MLHRPLTCILGSTLLLAALPTGGCASNASDDDELAAGDDEGTDPESTDPEGREDIDDPHSGRSIPVEPLRSCTDGLTQAQVADNVAITFDFEVSAHEMIACGGLVFGIVVSLVEGIATMVENPNTSTLPEGFSFEGGTYFIEPDGFQDLRMEVRFHYGRDYEAGAAGELITENLFLMSSYLVDAQASVEVDTSSGFPEVRIEVSHGGPGPLVELLGLGTQPPNPIVVTDSTLSDAQAHLRDLGVESIIFFTDNPGVSTIEYDVDSPLMLADSFLTGAPMQLNMVGASGWRADTEQEMTVRTWTVEYVDGVGALDGQIEFLTEGGRFDYVSRFDYDASGWPSIAMECAE